MVQTNQITIDIPQMPFAKAEELKRKVQEYVSSILARMPYVLPKEGQSSMCAEESPEAITLAALEEARSGQYAGVVDTSSEEAFMKSLGL